MEASQQPALGQTQPYQLDIIHQNIDQLMSAVLSANEDAISQNRTAGSRDDTSLRAHQGDAFKKFKDWMIEVQRKATKAIHEVETKLGLGVQPGSVQNVIMYAPLQDLPGIDPSNELNRLLGRIELSGKQSYKLRDFITPRLPSTFIIPQIVIAGENDGTKTMPPPQHYSEGGNVVVLKSTLRNVWVLQHAYARLLNHKEDLIKKYFATVAGAAANPSTAAAGVPVSRKFAREYYEEPSLANLPTKGKLGNLLDVQSSTYHSNMKGDIMLVLVSMHPAGSDGGSQPELTEAVTGNSITMNVDDNGNVVSTNGTGAYLTLPVTEPSIRKLYDAYRVLRNATSEQRRASRDKAFAATLPVDDVAELENQFNFGTSGGVGTGENNTTGKKRRRMLED